VTKLRNVVTETGFGVLAGLAGMVAMTASTKIEMRLRGRPASTKPAQAASKILGVKPEGEKQEKRLGMLTDWAYGTSWGAVRGLFGCLGLPAPAASAAHLATVWGAEQVVFPALSLGPPIPKWGAKETAIDLMHHLVYESATSATYELLR
jgi:hypothetical protein